MEAILLWIILGIAIGIYIDNGELRYKINNGIINFVHHYKPTHGKIVKKERENGNINYDTEARTKSSREKLCSKCDSPVEVIDKMPNHFFCHQCESIVEAKK